MILLDRLYLGTDHLTCKWGWGGRRLWFFVSFRIFFTDNTRVRIFIVFPEFNIRLYDKNSESDYYFFPPPNQNIFFSNIENQNTMTDVAYTNDTAVTSFEWNLKCVIFMTLNFHKKPQRDSVCLPLFFTFLLFLIYFIFFALYFFFQHADVLATACWRIGSYAPGKASVVTDSRILQKLQWYLVLC